MYFYDEIWLYIKEFMFHNIIKQGRHLRNDIYVQKFNKVIKNIPKPIIPLLGPKIIYSSASRDKGRRFIKYCYHLHTQLNVTTNIFDLFIRPRSYQLIECQMLPIDYDERNKYDEILREEYYNNYK